MAGVNLYKAHDFIEAIPGTGGIITAIARKVGCAWHTAKKYIDSYATVNRAYQDEVEKIADLAETKLIEQMTDGDGPMIRFYLSTKAKQRGYTQRFEFEQINREKVIADIKHDLEVLARQQVGRIPGPTEGDDPA